MSNKNESSEVSRVAERGESSSITSSNNKNNEPSSISSKLYYGSTAINNNEKGLLSTTESVDGSEDRVHKVAARNLKHMSSSFRRLVFDQHMEALSKIPLRRVALEVSLYVNLIITMIKFVAYIQTFSLSVLAALLDSVLDVVSQIVLTYTEKHSSLQRSSAHYPAGASRLEPIGVLTCAALMGMGSFEVLKQSGVALVTLDNPFDRDNADGLNIMSVWSMAAIVVVKLLLLWLCQHAADNAPSNTVHRNSISSGLNLLQTRTSDIVDDNTTTDEELDNDDSQSRLMGGESTLAGSSSKANIHISDPTLDALAQDHWNDSLSNAVAAGALLAALRAPGLWFLDPVGAILISFYIIWSWFETGKEQIEQLTGKSAPEDFIEELLEIANHFDERMLVDVCRAYHFGPKFLVEIEVVLPKNTLLFESHDIGMELQYEIESREEVERCFVHIDYEQRDYDEHVVSKVPELREKLRLSKEGLRWRSAQSL